MVNLILINLIIVYVWDILNFPNTLAGMITGLLTNGKITNVQLKPPFGCSFCMIFWVSLILLLVSSYNLLPAVFISLLSAYCSKIVLYLYTILDNLVEVIFTHLEKFINRLR